MASDLTKATSERDKIILIKKSAKYSFLFSIASNFIFLNNPCKNPEKTKPKLIPMNQEIHDFEKEKTISNKLKDMISKKVINDKVKNIINSNEMNCLFVCIHECVKLD